MKLFGTDGSPYVRKARVAIAEKGVACEFVAASPRDPASGVSAANPLAKIPTLLLDDGSAIYDSSVIAEYVDGIGSGPKLIPDAFAERIAVRLWEVLGNGILDAAVNIMHDRRLPEPSNKAPTMSAADAEDRGRPRAYRQDRRPAPISFMARNSAWAMSFAAPPSAISTASYRNSIGADAMRT